MKKRVFNLIILDESGSMYTIKNEAQTGVNETLQTIRTAQRKYDDQEHVVSFVSFNTEGVKTLLDCVPALEAKDIAPNDYNPNGGTPLYDAMGKAIADLRKHVADEDNVLVTIITDGYENASQEFSFNSIKALVEDRKKAGWVFAYIGAEHDVEAVAESLSIPNSYRFNREAGSTRNMSKKLAKSMKRMHERIDMCCCKEDMAKDFFKEE